MPKTNPNQPTRDDQPTMTAGQLVAWLSRFDPNTPVTVGLPDKIAGSVVHESWLNIECVSDMAEEDMSIILFTADDFDPRQL